MQHKVNTSDDIIIYISVKGFGEGQDRTTRTEHAYSLQPQQKKKKVLRNLALIYDTPTLQRGNAV